MNESINQSDTVENMKRDRHQYKTCLAFIKIGNKTIDNMFNQLQKHFGYFTSAEHFVILVSVPCREGQ